MRTAITLGVLLLGALTLSSTGCASDTQDAEVTGTTASSFEQWSATVRQEPDTGIWIVDGDTPIHSLDELRTFYETVVQNGALIVHRVGGADAKWSSTQKQNITYCVSRSSFGANYNRVVTAMANAAGAWEAIAAVNFVHVSAQDGNCTASNNNVVFDVRSSGQSGFSARAFFPNNGRSSRNVLIATGAASGQNPGRPETLTGLLRHELGHTLGFRHEHTRPESGDCFEDNNWRSLTTYDSASVMHYPWCGNGSNTGDLVLTSRDKQGAASLYGSP